MTAIGDQLGFDQPPNLLVAFAVINRRFYINVPDFVYIGVK